MSSQSTISDGEWCACARIQNGGQCVCVRMRIGSCVCVCFSDRSDNGRTGVASVNGRGWRG